LNLANRVWAEINLNNLEHNVVKIKNLLNGNTKIMAVVKADAYGHGVVEISKILLGQNVDMLAVAIIDEALQLRRYFDIPILILGWTPYELSDLLVNNDISQTIYTYEQAVALSQAAVKNQKKAKIHIKIDTGMGRIGFMCSSESIESIVKIAMLPNIELEGIFSHFSSADDPLSDDWTYSQFEKFNDFVREVEKKGVYLKYKHISNSAATLRFPQFHLDIVRPGIALYGVYPSEHLKNSIELLPVMSLKAKVTNVKWVPKGFPISYNRRYITDKPTKVATIPVGYADGYTRVGADKRRVLINGQYANIIGSVCMDMCMADVTHISDVQIGDEVVIIGRQMDKEILADELAKNIGTIGYEVVCSISKRIPRVYIKNNKPIKTLNYIL